MPTVSHRICQCRVLELLYLLPAQILRAEDRLTSLRFFPLMDTSGYRLKVKGTCVRLTRATSARNLPGKPGEVCGGINEGRMAVLHVLEA